MPKWFLRIISVLLMAGLIGNFAIASAKTCQPAPSPLNAIHMVELSFLRQAVVQKTLGDPHGELRIEVARDVKALNQIGAPSEETFVEESLPLAVVHQMIPEALV